MQEHLESTFSFRTVVSAPFCLDDKQTRQLLAKWSLEDTLRFAKFSFLGDFRPYQHKPFLKVHVFAHVFGCVCLCLWMCGCVDVCVLEFVGV